MKQKNTHSEAKLNILEFLEYTLISINITVLTLFGIL